MSSCVRPLSIRWVVLIIVLGIFCLVAGSASAAGNFEGAYFSGEGDVEYLDLLDQARRMFSPDPELQNVAMLYTPAWNGLVEGPTWGAWWIQNSYGPTYCGLPLLEEPFTTFLRNSHDLWFDQMGDGQRTWTHEGQTLVIPDGQLCDAAAPDWVVPKQGDGRVGIHDWGVEFTAAGLLMQAELLLIERDQELTDRYLPQLRRCADFIESRRDPQTNLFLVGPAGNLLAPSYAGWKKSEDTYEKAYLAGVSVTYIAALDRLIELEKLGGSPEMVQRYSTCRQLAREGLPKLVTDEGYFVKYIDPDGTRHGVYGAERHGYFEAVVNHDAICFRVVDDGQAERIYEKLASIPGLRPHNVIITNYPGLDDMYTPPTSWLWQFGTWVNGGHWSTCEARMVMSYYRLGHFDDARRSMQHMLGFARQFRMDNPLVEFGAGVYQPNQPINLCYDSFGPPAAMIRGLFEYLYGSEELVLRPHIPPSITQLQQHFPIRFGQKRLYLATTGSGPVTSVLMNERPWQAFDEHAIRLPYDNIPDEAVIRIGLGGAAPADFAPRSAKQPEPLPEASPLSELAWSQELFPVIATNELPLRIGADSQGGSRFIGQIAGVCVFDRALSDVDVEKLFAQGDEAFEGDAALVGNWTMDRVEDNAVLNGAAGDLPARVVGQCDIVDGPERAAARFNGEGFLELAHDSRLDLAHGCTLAAWIRPEQLASGGGRILDKCQVGASNGYVLDTHPGNSLRLITERGVLSHDAQLKPGVWVHVAATVDPAGALALYMDGKQVTGTKREAVPDLAAIDARIARIRDFHERLVASGWGESYEAAHARLAIEYQSVTRERLQMLSQNQWERLPGESQYAADKSYLATIGRLCEGLEQTVAGYKDAENARHKEIHALWIATEPSQSP